MINGLKPHLVRTFNNEQFLNTMTDYIEGHNQKPEALFWRASIEKTLENVRRGSEMLD